MNQPVIRIRHDLKRRTLTVREAVRLTPKMLRLLLEGSDLDGFVSMAPDDNVKLFIPTSSGSIERRDYTPRYYDSLQRVLAIDFAVHDAGPVTRWALQAKPGDTIEVGGPRGSVLVPWSFDWWLLIGDETALPAIARRVEEAPAGTRMISLVAVSDHDDQQLMTTEALHDSLWVRRSLDQADNPEPLLTVLRELPFPHGEGFVWIAAEARVARATRNYIVDVRGHPLEHTRAAGYWVKGQAEAYDKFDDGLHH